jgi:hypothetical protein
MRIEEGWARQRRGLRREIRQEERRLAALESELERSSVHGVELDRLARDVERSRRRLGRLSEDTRRKMIEVQETEASRPWVTDMLRGRSKRTAVEGLGRADRRAVSSSEEAREVVERTVGRGATMPGTGLGGGGAYDGPPRPSGGTAVAAGAPGDGPGHGTTPDSEATGVSEEGLPALEGALTWEGPLPPPRSGWDSGLVGEVRAAHPELDDVDVRILLGLIGRALGPDSGEVAVAGLVRSLLQQNGRLALRGGEGQLSELYRPGLLEEEQVEVVFVLVVEER